MPIAPDRRKGRIAAMVMERLRVPSLSERFAASNSENVEEMRNARKEAGEKSMHYEAGKIALRAMYSAMQSGDFDAAWAAFCQAKEAKEFDSPEEYED